MFLHELVSEQTNKYGFFEYDAETYKSSFQEHMKNLYQDIFYCELFTSLMIFLSKTQIIKAIDIY